jgi:periplasmic divalent cation tolerance protein
MNESKPCVVLVTASDRNEAERIAAALVKWKMAACVSILPGIESTFWWEGKIDTAAEFLLLVKTTMDRFPDVEAAVKEYHSYKVPEIVALPIEAGHAPYLRWLADSVHPDAP